LPWLLLFTSLAAINVRGVRHGVRLTIITTIAKLIPLLLLILIGMFYMHRGNFHWTGAPSLAKVGEGSLLTFFAYQGAEEALGPSAEIHNPRRIVPLAILYATVGLIVLYVLRSSASVHRPPS
jgi:amino acid transporter